ncbi:MAG TPA: hypothetical protein VFT22_13700 [Kofleriaceae bacterium]|nr:hypothetical protein [Kofleriaceae bacterium]
MVATGLAVLVAAHGAAVYADPRAPHTDPVHAEREDASLLGEELGALDHDAPPVQARTMRGNPGAVSCSGGVPIYSQHCDMGCQPYHDAPGTCFRPEVCREGGTYCGGHLVDGDPGTLYVCRSGDGTAPVQCPLACLFHGDGDDECL